MLINDYVDVKVNSHTINKYKELGYENVKLYETISVKVDDAPFNSRAKLKVKCDYCGEEFETSVFCYKTSIKTISKNACNKKECKSQKTKEINKLKYGVDNVMKLPEFKEKVKETNLEKYGSENPLSNPEVKAKRDNTMLERYGTTIPLKNKDLLEKTHQTNIERYGVATPMESQELKMHYVKSIREKYGVDWISQNQDIRQKQIETCRKKYGVDNPLQSLDIQKKIERTNLEKYGVLNSLNSPEIRQKRDMIMIEKYGSAYALQNQDCMNKLKQTNLERYGCECSLQNLEVREKSAKTLYKTGNVSTSKQQLYLYDLYNQNGRFKLNYPISYYHADLCSTEEMLVIEYDGSGHQASVLYGLMTPEEFQRKEIIRSAVLKREGYKTMHITSTTDLLPSDTTLLQLLSYTRQYFSEYPNHSWINFSIDTSQVFNAENKEGIFFNYGELHRLKQSA